jgi:hypothetical protein
LFKQQHLRNNYDYKSEEHEESDQLGIYSGLSRQFNRSAQHDAEATHSNQRYGSKKGGNRVAF